MSVVCMGELLIDFVALETGVSVGEAWGFQKAPGGAPANVAAALARLGDPVSFLGQVGDDPFGHYLADVLREEGVDVSGLRFSTEARTMLAFVSLAAGGERSFSFYRHPSADVLMTPADVDLARISAAKVFHFGSITLIKEPARSATRAALDHAREQGLLISYDPNLRLNLWDSAETARTGMLSGFEYAHIVKLSEEELTFLTGGEYVESLWREHTQLIVVTRGDGGSTAHLANGRVDVPAQSVRAVDTTGAGDAFVAGLLHQVLAHLDDPALFSRADGWGDRLHFANTLAALTTTKRGAISALPERHKITAMLSSIG